MPASLLRRLSLHQLGNIWQCSDQWQWGDQGQCGDQWQRSNRWRRDALFLASWMLSLALFCVPLSRLFALALRDSGYSHTVLIPLICGFLIYWHRKAIFSSCQYSPVAAIPWFAASAAIFGVGQLFFRLDGSALLSLTIAALVLAWVAGFVLFFGRLSLRAAALPFFLLLFMIPWPEILTHQATVALQRASAEMAYFLFKMLGIPVFRQNLTFSLPGVSIEVAEECSGIRSAIALLITSLLAGQILLQSAGRRFLLCLFAIPVAILKNSIRIVTLSGLGIYVDPGFLTGTLHHYGGLPFSLLAITILVPVLVVLQKGESTPAAGK
jgi:exosortase